MDARPSSGLEDTLVLKLCAVQALRLELSMLYLPPTDYRDTYPRPAGVGKIRSDGLSVTMTGR